MSKITEWNPGEKMSKEFALATVKQVKQMFRCHFNNPNFDLFNNQRELFDTMMDALDGLDEFINSSQE